MDFKLFAKRVKAQFDEMAKGELFQVDLDGGQLFEDYNDDFPAGTNEIYLERREHDCQCCRQFIKNIGNVVSIVDGRIVTVWDIAAQGLAEEYRVVALIMADRVRNTPIKEMFRHIESRFGQDMTVQQLEDGGTINWNHFHCVVPNKFVSHDHRTIVGKSNSDIAVFRRGVNELTEYSIDTVLDLMESNNLHRGEEFADGVKSFKKLHTGYFEAALNNRDVFLWSNLSKAGARIRNTAIGTLLQDLSEGKELGNAVGSYESKVSGGSYKRTSALVTPAMAKKAFDSIVAKGLEDSIPRRFAVIEDINITNVLFADKSVSSVMKGSLEDMIMKGASQKPMKSTDKVREVAIQDFLDNILPRSSSVEVLMKNTHSGNLMSLVAPVAQDPEKLFQWDNNFSWSYNGNIADSMKERVVAAGGRVDGVLRFTHSWNHDGKNQSLMDLHVFMPNSGYTKRTKAGKEIHDNYPAGNRVGWNNRNDNRSGGVQDVDFTSRAGTKVPIENITFPNLNRMPEGEYIFKIHNWSFRDTTTSGFKAEIEFGNELHEYEHSAALGQKEWITVAKAVLKNGQFTIKNELKSTTTSKEVWGVETETFRKVSSVMLSPNHWDGNKTGNRHFFFMLEDCVNPDRTRGFYNEFLRKDLTEDRKAFEMIADKFKCEESTNQLSGLGFSSTQRNELIVRVKGDLTQTLKLKF